MSPLRMTALATLIAVAFLLCRCSSPALVIRPMIYAESDQAAVAMRTAPVILLVRIAKMRLTGDTRMVPKPPEVGGPIAPTIPLHLARINAEVLLTIQGQAPTTIEFYSWIWASGSHGGPRLFSPDPGAIRVIFLRDEGGYLHTVGDYPSYDLELSSRWVPALLAGWKSGQVSNADPVERLVALRLRAELEGLTENQLREDFGEDGPRVNHHWVLRMYDLVRLVGPLFVVTQLDDLCLHSGNTSARLAACFVTARDFPGRCKAYVIARKATADEFGGVVLAKMFTYCQEAERHHLDDLRSGTTGRIGFYGASMSPQHRRETLRVYASAMDDNVHRVACEVAAAISESRDLPECSGARSERRRGAPYFPTSL